MRGDNSCPKLTRAMIDKMPPELRKAFWRTEHAMLSVLLKREIQIMRAVSKHKGR